MAFGSLCCGILMDRFGRKTTHLILNVPFVISWCMISMSGQLATLLLGRSLTGFCAGLLSPVGPTYLAEISDPKHRGFFLGSVTFAIAFGVLLTHSMALYVKWTVNAIVCALFPLISYVLITFAPESPSWLLRKNRIQEAYHSFKWLRGADERTIKEFQSMIDAQMKTTNSNQHQNDDVDNDQYQKQNERHCSNLIKKFHELIMDTSFTRPWIILSVYFATLQLSGSTVITFYTVSILRESLGTQINEYTATLIIDIMRLISSMIACIAMRNVGRRILTIISGISTAICLFSLSIYLYLSTKMVNFTTTATIPLILFAIYILVLSIGISPLPWCLTSELFPLRYRAIGTAFVTFFNFLCFFGVVKTNPSFFEAYGASYTFFIYGVFTIAGTIFLIVYLPETKNKSLQEIEDSYNVKQKISRNKIQP